TPAVCTGSRDDTAGATGPLHARLFLHGSGPLPPSATALAKSQQGSPAKCLGLVWSGELLRWPKRPHSSDRLLHGLYRPPPGLPRLVLQAWACSSAPETARPGLC